MNREAKVVLKDGRLVAELTRTEACASCGACRHGKEEVLTVDLPEGDFIEGEMVELTLEDGRVTQASLIAYGIPLLGLIAGIFLGGIFGGDGMRLLMGLLLTALSYLAVRLIGGRMENSGNYRPKALRCGMMDTMEEMDKRNGRD